MTKPVEGGAPDEVLANRPMHEKLSLNPDVPDDTELWAALQSVSGGSWGGCVYDTALIKQRLNFNAKK